MLKQFNSQKLIVIALVVVSAFLLTGCTNQTDDSQQTSTPTDNVATNEVENNEQQGGHTYTLAEVQKHSSKDDCWMIVNDKVYEVTSYISGHPGGDAILEGCGKEATELFNTKGGQGSGHSAQAESILAEYFIGDLEE